MSFLFCSSALAKPEPHASITETALNVTSLQPNVQAVIAVVMKVKAGYHAQSHTPSGKTYKESDADSQKDVRFELTLDASPAVAASLVGYQAGDSVRLKVDPEPLNVYEGTVITYVYLQMKPDAAVGHLKLTGSIHYQDCNENSCFPPTDAPFTLETEVVAPGPVTATPNADLFKNVDPKIFAKLAPATGPTPPAPPSTTQSHTTLFGHFELRKDSFTLAFIAAFLAGIIFNAVPCVLPVLPLKAIGFYEVSKHNRARSIAYGAVFSLGLIASFAALGMIVLVKKVVGWGEIYSNIYFNIAIVVILLVMAVGTFGFFTINLPTAVYNVTPRHDTFFGNFQFGILTAVLSTPCTFGLFFGLLAWAADQPPAVAIALMMTVGAGMASPYFALSAFPEVARKFPRTGPWSELVKQLMSFLLLGSAVFFARRFIEPYTGQAAFWYLLFAVAAAGSLFLLERTFRLSASLKPRLIAGIFAILITGGTFLAVRQLANEPLKWTPYSQAALDAGIKDGRVVVVEFTASWCSTCKYLEVESLNRRK